MVRDVERMMRGPSGDRVAPHVRCGVEEEMNGYEDMVRSRHREMKGQLDELLVQLRKGFSRRLCGSVVVVRQIITHHDPKKKEHRLW